MSSSGDPPQPPARAPGAAPRRGNLPYAQSGLQQHYGVPAGRGRVAFPKGKKGGQKGAAKQGAPEPLPATSVHLPLPPWDPQGDDGTECQHLRPELQLRVTEVPCVVAKVLCLPRWFRPQSPGLPHLVVLLSAPSPAVPVLTQKLFCRPDYEKLEHAAQRLRAVKVGDEVQCSVDVYRTGQCVPDPTTLRPLTVDQRGDAGLLGELRALLEQSKAEQTRLPEEVAGDEVTGLDAANFKVMEAQLRVIEGRFKVADQAANLLHFVQTVASVLQAWSEAADGSGDGGAGAGAGAETPRLPKEFVPIVAKLLKLPKIWSVLQRGGSDSIPSDAAAVVADVRKAITGLRPFVDKHLSVEDVRHLNNEGDWLTYGASAHLSEGVLSQLGCSPKARAKRRRGGRRQGHRALGSEGCDGSPPSGSAGSGL